MGNRSSSSSSKPSKLQLVNDKHKQKVPQVLNLHWKCKEVLSFKQSCAVCARDLSGNQLIKGDESRIVTWGQLLCAAHEDDGSIRCCSCRRFKPKNCKKCYKLSDGRHLCPDCFPTAVLGTKKLKSLIDEVLDFFKTLKFPNLHKMDFPILSAELIAIPQNSDRIQKGLSQVGGLTVRNNDRVVHGVDMCKIKGEEITAMKSSHQLSGGPTSGILILFGLPKVLTSSWLVHELMRAWLLLNGYESLEKRCEEAICEMVENIWLDKLENSMSSRLDLIPMHLIYRRRSTLLKFSELHEEAENAMQGNGLKFLLDEIIKMKKALTANKTFRICLETNAMRD